jgi:hypothetical protein
MSKRRKLEARLQKLFETSKGVMEMEIIKTPEQLPQLMLAMCNDDLDAQRKALIINDWLSVLNRARPGTATLCGRCPHEFSRTSLPAAMMIATPFAGTIPQAVVLGICETCCEQVGWDNMPDFALQLWRKISPQAYVTPIGGT